MKRMLYQNSLMMRLIKSIENLWSVLFTTGYLTHKGCTESGKYRLVIPNKEVRNLFVKKIQRVVF